MRGTSLAESGYRGRIAPSPSGYLHLGHAQTFLMAYERALAAKGTLMLRNDDLDEQRSQAHFAIAMLEDLHWLGLRWSEGPQWPDGVETGACGPYAQSQRRAFYRAAFERLRAMGAVYPCSCSRRDLLDAVRAPHADEEDEPVYPGTCRPAALDAVVELDPATARAWRFRVRDGEAVTFTDLQQGPQRLVAGEDFGDFLVLRRDGVPSYQLACVVDDAAMGITEVVRGRDLLKSTARQMLLQRALGLPTPAYFHCDLMLNEGGQRLAKRHDALSLRGLRAAGSTPQEIMRRLSKPF